MRLSIGHLESEVYGRSRSYLRGYLAGGSIDDFFDRELPRIELTEDSIVELSRLAEDYGFNAVWTYNFVADRDRFMCLGLAAKQTKQIKLGPGSVGSLRRRAPKRRCPGA